MPTRWNHERYSAAVAAYLTNVADHEVLPRAPTPNPDPSEAELDIAWAERGAGGSGWMVRLMASGLRRAGSEHLRGIAALLPTPEVGLAVDAPARASCESSARLLWLLDPAAPREERLARSFNYGVLALARGSAGRQTALDAATRDAKRLASR